MEASVSNSRHLSMQCHSLELRSRKTGQAVEKVKIGGLPKPRYERKEM
jgi:hypothetical protein